MLASSAAQQLDTMALSALKGGSMPCRWDGQAAQQQHVAHLVGGFGPLQHVLAIIQTEQVIT